MDKASSSNENNRTESVNSNQMLEEVQSELRSHRASKQSQSYLSSIFDSIYRADDRSLSNLETIEKELKLADPQVALSKDKEKLVRQAIENDRYQTSWQESINKWGGVVAKTAPLFLNGKVGFVGAAISNALSEAKPSESTSAQLTDLALGATKGLLLKSAFSSSSLLPVSGVGGLALRATALGATSRAIDTGLSRSNYLDATGADYSLNMGLANLAKQTFHPYAIATDLASLGLSAGILGAANQATGGALLKDAILSRVSSGASFGFASGSLEEAQKQLAAGNSIDFSQIFLNGTKQALASGIAAIPGGIQARANDHPSFTYKYPKADTTATVVVSLEGGKKTLVIQRGLNVEAEPGKTAFPGGFLEIGKENIYAAAARELREETGLVVKPSDLKLVDVRSNPLRDQRGHVVDIGFRWDVPLNLTESVLKHLHAGDDAANARVIPTADLMKTNMAFDHNQLRDGALSGRAVEPSKH